MLTVTRSVQMLDTSQKLESRMPFQGMDITTCAYLWSPTWSVDLDGTLVGL